MEMCQNLNKTQSQAKSAIVRLHWQTFYIVLTNTHYFLPRYENKKVVFPLNTVCVSIRQASACILVVLSFLSFSSTTCLCDTSKPVINSPLTTKELWQIIPSSAGGSLYTAWMHIAPDPLKSDTWPNIFLPHQLLPSLHLPTAYRRQHFEKRTKFGHIFKKVLRTGSPCDPVPRCISAYAGVCRFQGRTEK